MADYFYKIYGLIIESCFKIPELEQVFEDYESSDEKWVDVIIKKERMPAYIKQKIANNIFSDFTIEDSWFVIDDIAIYRMVNGNKIIIESLGGTLKEIKTYLLGSAFGCILIQKNIMAIHGSSLVMNNNAIIITGESGAGKSTLSSAFRIKGSRFLSDDVSAVTINRNDNIFVSPAYPQQKLCRDAAIKLGLNVQELEYIDEDRDKFAVHSKEGFEESGKQLRAIFEISVDESISTVQWKEVLGVEKINLILKNVYRIEFVYMMGIYNEYLKNVIKAAAKVKCFRIIRPKNVFSVDDEINIVNEKMKAII